MFNNFIMSFNTVFPLFVLIVLGAFLNKRGLCSDVTQTEVSTIVFKALLPCLIFKNIYYTDMEKNFNPKFILFTVSMCFVSYVFSCIVGLLEKTPKKRGALIHGCFRSNTILYGIAILGNMYDASELGGISIALAVQIPITNILAVYTLEKYRGGRVKPLNIAKGIVTNPIIIATVIAILMLAAGIQLPEFMNKTVTTVGNMASPVALLFMGAGIKMSKVRENHRNLVIGVLVRLVIIPAIILLLTYAVGYRGVEMASIVVMYAAPTAITAYSMSVAMDSDGDLTGEIVTFTTVFASVTMFLWIFAMSSLDLI